MIAAADSLMGIFGMKRARCADCSHGLETRPGIDGVACPIVNEIVKADDQCPRWEAIKTADLALAYPDVYGELS